MAKNDKQNAAENTPEKDVNQTPETPQEETAEVPEEQEIFTVTREQMEKMEGLAKALAAEQDKYLRLAAEYDNYRKRTAKEKESLYNDAKIDTVKKGNTRCGRGHDDLGRRYLRRRRRGDGRGNRNTCHGGREKSRALHSQTLRTCRITKQTASRNGNG